MYRINKTDQPRKPGLHATRLLDPLRERLRYLHDSLRTEPNDVDWARGLIRWQGVRHPKDMGGKEVDAFLSMRAHERKVTLPPPLALSALLLLDKDVLDREWPWRQESG